MAELRNKLEELVTAAGPMIGELGTETGKEWARRRAVYDKDHKDNSEDWDELRDLMAEPYRVLKFRGGGSLRLKVPLLHSIMLNHVADIYHRNPEPYIQSRTSDRDKRQDRAARDLAKTLHKDCQTERKMKRALLRKGYTGFDVIWASFHQEGYLQDAPITDEGGEPVLDEYGEQLPELEPTGEPEQEYVATSQRVKLTLVGAHNFRKDPDSREADFSDAKYIVYRYKRTLKEWWEDERIPMGNRRKLVQFIKQQRQQNVTRQAPLDSSENDPGYILVECDEIWSKVEKMTIQLPVGADFEMISYPWPKILAEKNKYPARMIATNEGLPDSRDEKGGYPIPDGRFVRALCEDLNRLYELFIDAATNVVNKYISIEGLVDSAAFAAMAGSDEKEVVLIKLDALKNMLGMSADISQVDLRRLLIRFPTSEEQLKALGFADMIDKIHEQIYQLISQGPGDRGGVSEADSATEAANIRAKLDQRQADVSEDIAQAYDDITELMFLLLIEHQTLPIPYQRSTGHFTQPVWDQFVIDELLGHDLAFTHATGSARPQNRAQVKAERRELAAVVMPFLQGPLNRPLRRMIAMTIEPYDNDEAEAIIEDQSPEIARELLKLNIAIQENPQLAADPKIARQKQELETQLIMAVLSPADLEAVATADQPVAGGSAVGSTPAGKSTGEKMASEAAAGQTNIM